MDVSKVVATVKKNVANAQQVVRFAIPKLTERPCTCSEALKFAVMTDPKAIPADAQERLGLLINKYYK